MSSFCNVKVHSYIYISVAPYFFSHVFLSVFHCPRVIVCLEKRLDVKHGLLNVLTEAVRVLRVQKGSERRFE